VASNADCAVSCTVFVIPVVISFLLDPDDILSTLFSSTVDQHVKKNALHNQIKRQECSSNQEYFSTCCSAKATILKGKFHLRIFYYV